MFFDHNSGDDLTVRCKMRLRWLCLDWWKYFLCFPVILGYIRIRIPEFGVHLTEFGRAWKARTQNWRKSMFSTWIMNNSVCGSFLDVMRPYNNFTSHIWPSPKIWLETEHFEFLSYSWFKWKTCSFFNFGSKPSRLFHIQLDDPQIIVFRF